MMGEPVGEVLGVVIGVVKGVFKGVLEGVLEGVLGGVVMGVDVESALVNCVGAVAGVLIVNGSSDGDMVVLSSKLPFFSASKDI